MRTRTRCRSKSRVIHVTEKPKPTGYRILDDDIRVSVNPISWRGLGAACVAALTGLPQIVSRATGGVETSMQAPDRDEALKSGRLVLVAEDHPVNQELIRHQLSLLGFACDVAHDGVEALAALKNTRYGFLITDCHMPNMTGYELARRVRASELGTSQASADSRHHREHRAGRTQRCAARPAWTTASSSRPGSRRCAIT